MPNDRWSPDFVADQFIDARRLRILVVVDDCTRECLALVPDTSISGIRVARELDQLMVAYGKPKTIVQTTTRSSGIKSRPASRFRTPSPSPSSVASAASCSMRRCSARSHIRAPFWKLAR